MDPPYDHPLPTEQRDALVAFAKDHALANGVLVRLRENPSNPDQVTFPPHMLLPSPFPRHCFLRARAVQTDFNLLMHRVAHDHDFLHQCFKETIKVDDFSRRLWDIYQTVRSEGVSQPLSLGLNRSDYMLACEQPTEDIIASGAKLDPASITIKQVEFNTMASSFGGLCDKLSKHHRYVFEAQGWHHLCDRLPENGALDGLSEGMVYAWEQYRNPSAAILFLVSDGEWNLYDQRWLEYAVKNRNPKIKVIRRSIQALKDTAKLGPNQEMLLDNTEIAVVYFRMCYHPSHFENDQDWATRLLIERSRAIKCPSIHYFLAGMKKVQQMLATAGVVQKYLSDPEAVQRVTDTFAGQYTLDVGSEGDKNIAMATESPHKYVVKPQREGGGNNTFGDDIPKLLKELCNTDERNAYILMERICPAPFRGYALRPDTPVNADTFVSELGIFGIVVGSADEVLLNKEQGHILRTKTWGVDEGGVAAGFAGLDSLCLI